MLTRRTVTGGVRAVEATPPVPTRPMDLSGIMRMRLERYMRLRVGMAVGVVPAGEENETRTAVRKLRAPGPVAIGVYVSRLSTTTSALGTPGVQPPLFHHWRAEEAAGEGAPRG